MGWDEIGFAGRVTDASENGFGVSRSGKMIFGKPIFVALAQRREARRQQLEQQFARSSMGGIMPGGMPAQQMVPAGVVATGGRPGQMMPAAMSQVLCHLAYRTLHPSHTLCQLAYLAPPHSASWHIFHFLWC